MTTTTRSTRPTLKRTSKKPAQSSTTMAITKRTKNCFAINIWYGQPLINEWCQRNCRDDSCEDYKHYCSCDPDWKPNTSCKASKLFGENKNIEKWCNNTCPTGYCLKTFCDCD